MPVLILSSAKTWFAEYLASQLRLFGSEATVVTDTSDLHISVACSGGEGCSSHVATGDKVAYSAIVNLGLPVASGESGDGFADDEWNAALWSALHSFSGPVINRPTLDGIDPCAAIRRSIPGHDRHTHYVYDHAESSRLYPGCLCDRQRNIYDEWTGELLARFAAGEPCPHAVWRRGIRIVDYAPGQVLPIVTFGGRVFRVDGGDDTCTMPLPSCFVLGSRDMLTHTTVELSADSARLLSTRVPTRLEDVGAAADDLARAVFEYLCRQGRCLDGPAS